MTPGKSLVERFGLEEVPDLKPHYSIAPKQVVVIIRLDRDTLQRRLARVKWGLIPFWAKDSSIGNRLINARAESASQKPAFRSAFKTRRCLVPADGFYEWKKRGGKQKQPYLVRIADGSPFAFAGLWESWTGPDGETIESCTILTTDANDLTRPIHDRMPVILHPKDYDLWLDPEVKDLELLKPLLRPYPSAEMKVEPVSPRVNKATYDAPDCVEAVSFTEK
ncbi:MAG: SOS response-associated peptidase [Desulfomonile tiedjei]|uniref:Abasic site processing protein n=1 Tax=Desulfomonile tiedjei TaxID=2358 RepID=A0A9D6UXD2_9BACT|nr:SOS response-associated peptidase [Desulfomonile tiedjei]